MVGECVNRARRGLLYGSFYRKVRFFFYYDEVDSKSAPS